MIGFLQGRLLRSTPQQVLLDVHGVGYAVHIPLSTYSEIEKSAAARGGDGQVRLHIHTHLREDGIALYGFWSEREKLLFEKLIAVGGIGPRLAQVILSGMAPNDLIIALASADVARLTTIPGVGRKTAERMVVELRDRVKDLAAELPPPSVPGDGDLVEALVNLGYKTAHAERAVQQARADQPDAAFHDLLRLALRRLARV
jgi:Holliday junction DNA helicase RuvA